MLDYSKEILEEFRHLNRIVRGKIKADGQWILPGDIVECAMGSSADGKVNWDNTKEAYFVCFTDHKIVVADKDTRVLEGIDYGCVKTPSEE